MSVVPADQAQIFWPRERVLVQFVNDTALFHARWVLARSSKGETVLTPDRDVLDTNLSNKKIYPNHQFPAKHSQWLPWVRTCLESWSLMVQRVQTRHEKAPTYMKRKPEAGDSGTTRSAKAAKEATLGTDRVDAGRAGHNNAPRGSAG